MAGQEPMERDALTARETPPPEGPSNRGCFHLVDDGDNFVRTDRAEPKTRPSSAPPEPIALEALLAQFQAGPLSDASMRRADHEPRMVKDCHFGRVEEENRNVVVEGWVLASRKEDDNDFHLILSAVPDPGDPPDVARIMNVEISGLPPDDVPGRDQLVHARQAFKDHFVPTVPDKVTSSYTSLEPVHVRIMGSLFFDVDHPAGNVGPGKLKPKTAWEIHPILDLQILE